MKDLLQEIREAIAKTKWSDADPRIVECFMRLEYGTLGQLDARTFKREARIGAQLTIEHPEHARGLAASYGVKLDGAA